MQKFKIKIVLLLIIAVAAGILIHYLDLFSTVILMLLWLLAAIASIILLINGIVKKKFRLWWLIGFLPLMSDYAFETVVRNDKHKEALRLNVQLEDYKTKHGNYPGNLESIKTSTKLRGLQYHSDSSGTKYRFEYLMDQFNREYYESNTKTWGTLGWND